jgi:hypothetical protein
MSEREKSNVTPGKVFTHPSEVMLLHEMLQVSSRCYANVMGTIF